MVTGLIVISFEAKAVLVRLNYGSVDLPLQALLGLPGSPHPPHSFSHPRLCKIANPLPLTPMYPTRPRRPEVSLSPAVQELLLSLPLPVLSSVRFS
jgi:hypothetical protein